MYGESNMNIKYILSKIIQKLHVPAIINSNIQKNAKVGSASQCVNVDLGNYSYIGNSCTLINVRVGKFCSIADNCIIGGASHPTDWGSTSPVFYRGKNILGRNFSNHYYDPYKKTIIASDVWIGSSCLIRSGVTIETGAVIGMGSVVTKDIGPYEIWAGNPAKLIKKRFSEDIILELVQSKWWESSDKLISEYAKQINNIESFVEITK
jgi:acetyltransferase-like isoleucine patch superfamily enzyme